MSGKKQVFVSYSRADKDKVFSLVETLENGVGAKFWIDLEGIESTAQFLNVIRQAIEDSKVVLFMLSDNSINGEWTQREIMFAKECGKRVVPVILDGGGLRDWTKLYFANVNYVDAKSKRQIEKLSKEITGWIELETPAVSRGVEKEVPLSTRSLATKRVLLRLVASLRNILSVIGVLLIILLIVGLCMKKDDKGVKDEESVQNTELTHEGDTVILPAASDAVVPVAKDVARTQTSTVESSASDKGNVTSEQSLTNSSATSTKSTATTEGTINGHAYVDLGLSVKWATCNVGASSPTDYGNYYAWGETATKSTYTEENSNTYGKSMGDIGGNYSYDAARANWGGSWHLPTKAEFKELIDNSESEWETVSGVKGCKFTSKKNGKSIFLPAAGWRERSSMCNAGEIGFYWGSTPYGTFLDSACVLYFDSEFCHSLWYNRYGGRSVRPVSE